MKFKKISKICEKCHGHGSGCSVYGLGLIGAMFYYLPMATSFWTGVIAFLKALVWPAYVVYGLLNLLGM